MSKGRDKRKNVVIVGGGHAGTLLARTLSATLDSARYNLLLISDRPYAIHLLAAARMTITGDGNFEQLALMPYQKMFVNGNGRAIIDRVTAIEERARGKGGVLVLQSGKRIEYAALALACGFLWSGPLDFPYVDEDIRAHIKQWRKMYADASHVVLVGGGAVGIGTCLSVAFCVRGAFDHFSCRRDCRGITRCIPCKFLQGPALPSGEVISTERSPVRRTKKSPSSRQTRCCSIRRILTDTVKISSAVCAREALILFSTILWITSRNSALLVL